jgi:hypothetical protein
MKRSSLIVAAALCIVIGAGSSAFAELTAEQTKQADALIAQFGAAEFGARQKAVDALIAIRPDVVPLVKKALVETTDNEVKLRCEIVLKTLVKLNKMFGYGPSKITLDVKDAPLADVVQRLADQSGNRCIDIPDNLKGKTVMLSVKDLDYWQAVEILCDKIKVSVGTGWAVADDKFHLSEADKNLALSAFSGPIVVKVDFITKTAPFSGHAVVQMNCMGTPCRYAGKARGENEGGVDMALRYYLEDRLAPLTSDIAVRKVTTPDGVNVMPPGDGAWPWGGGLSSDPWGAIWVGLPEIPRTIDRFAEVSGVVRLEFGSGVREAVLDDVVKSTGKDMKLDDWTVKVVKADPHDGWLSVYLDASCKGEPVNLPAWTNARGYGWWLRDGEGGKTTRGDDAFQLEQLPKKGQSAVHFHSNFQEGAWSLVLVLPKVHETKEYPFTIKDVPLP